MGIFAKALLIATTAASVAQAAPATLETRTTSRCDGNYLVPADTDGAIQQLRDWASINGGQQVNAGMSPVAITKEVGSTVAYACVNNINAGEFFTVDDINFALGWMDSDCHPYEQTVFWWPGNGNKVVGKAAVGTPICTGP